MLVPCDNLFDDPIVDRRNLDYDLRGVFSTTFAPVPMCRKIAKRMGDCRLLSRTDHGGSGGGDMSGADVEQVQADRTHRHLGKGVAHREWRKK